MLNNEELQLVRRSGLFDGLDITKPPGVLDTCKILKFAGGDHLFEENDRSRGIYFIIDGIVQLIRGNKKCKPAILSLRQRGQFVGVTANLCRRCHYATGKTGRASKVLLIRGSALTTLSRRYPVIHERLISAVGENILQMARHFERLQQLQTTERLADFLLTSVTGDADETELTLPCDKGMIATYLGMERESFSRALAKLRNVGVIAEGRHIHLTNATALRELRDSLS